jgi:hypothetical protein
MDQLSAPAVAFLEAWQRAVGAASQSGWLSMEALPLVALAGVTAQAACLLAVCRRRWREPWWRVGAAFVALLLVIKAEIWLGAYLRVLLPLTFAFNLLLPPGRMFWPLFVAGNAGLSTSLLLLGDPLG